MKVAKIELEEGSVSIYRVTLVPNFIERIFGIKEKTKRFKDTGTSYLFGSCGVYITQYGKKLENGNHIAEAIDRFKRAF